ncbi:MAG: hypothetical protein R3220_06145 [Balneolaceae bacterium]|nr:hypothetical protein [Balneolaceae bacterium]
MIREVRASDAESICSIYNTYITDTQITFEEDPLPVEEVHTRIQTISKKYP